MILSYGMSIIGSSHAKTKIACQDTYKTIKLDNGWIIAAVADGVGSCRHSEVASSIAVEISTRFCFDRISDNLDLCDLTGLIAGAFENAELAIERRSLEDNNPITDYDTTLSMAVYNGTQIAYGHCGDGGIIGLTKQGDYKKITTPQKKDGVFVIPLRAGKDTWIFGYEQEELASVLLATDGIYDIFFPYLLIGQPVEIYVPLIRYFMDNNCLKISEETETAVSEERGKFLTSEACASITDDKTALVLVNADVLPKIKEQHFYAEPDWDTLQLKWNKIAYPHLYKDE